MIVRLRRPPSRSADCCPPETLKSTPNTTATNHLLSPTEVVVVVLAGIFLAWLAGPILCISSRWIDIYLLS